MPRTVVKKSYREVTVNGKTMPVIPESKLAEHDCVNQVYDLAVNLNETIKEIKSKIEVQVNNILEAVAAEHGETWKGNAHLFNLDETRKVMVKVQPLIKFSKEMAIAKQKYDQWLSSQSASKELQNLVKRTFAVNSEGNIPKSKLMALRNFDSDDPIKIQADEIVDKAIRKEIRKPYITIYEKDDDENWQRVQLNFSEV